MDDFVRRLAAVRPHPRQVAWQQREWTAFFHFGISTFTDREWGTGREDPALFNPTSVDTDQWCRVIRDAGMRGCILTAKHHDGFCLWDTRQTRHGVMSSLFGQDIVRMLADSCARYGLDLGLYLSPWDRNASCYGEGKVYNDFFCAQLTELLTGYGPLFELWFDGACGEGPNGKVQQYDWTRIYGLIREYQPDACIAVCGPDVRWCGNEAGQWRPSEWSVVPAALQDCEKVQAASQQQDDASFREACLRSCEMDLGSRAVMAAADAWAWYPAEVNTSIRPGWFYHPAEDDHGKPVPWLVDLYEHTVGGNAVLLLNIPPTQEGRIHPKDEAKLLSMGEAIRHRYMEDVARNAVTWANHAESGHPAAQVLVEDESYWTPGDGQPCAELRLDLAAPATIARVMLEEQIREGQRIERFTLYALTGGEAREIYAGTTVGYRKICAFAPVYAESILVRIKESRVAPTLRRVSVFA